MMREIYLHGDLAEKFGASFKFDLDTPSMAGRALACCVPGFAEYIHDKWVRVVRGDLENGLDFDESTLNFRLGLEPQLHIVPMAAGAIEGKSIAKIVLGAALIALSFVFPGFGVAGAAASATLFGASASTTLLVAGAAMALGGLASLLAPTPSNKAKDNDKPAERASFIFNGPVNRVEEGGVLPVGFGRMRVGSILGSASLQIEKLL
jgi:predicted phage tail protein